MFARGTKARARIYSWADWEDCTVVSAGVSFVTVADIYGIMHDIPNRFDRIRKPF